MRKNFLLSIATVTIVGSAFAFVHSSTIETFCNPREGGAGLCVKNQDEGGFKCVSRDYLGDCSGTRWEEVAEETNP